MKRRKGQLYEEEQSEEKGLERWKRTGVPYNSVDILSTGMPSTLFRNYTAQTRQEAATPQQRHDYTAQYQ